MSAPVAKSFHMEKVDLSRPKVHTILSQLGEWLPNAKFERDGKVEKCADADLDHYCRPLFDELDILSKVSFILQFHHLRITSYCL